MEKGKSVTFHYRASACKFVAPGEIEVNTQKLLDVSAKKSPITTHILAIHQHDHFSPSDFKCTRGEGFPNIDATREPLGSL